MVAKTLNELLEDRQDIEEELRGWRAMRDYFADMVDAAEKNEGATFETVDGEYTGTDSPKEQQKFSSTTLSAMFATSEEIINELSQAIEQLGSMTFEVDDYEENSEETNGDSHEEED